MRKQKNSRALRAVITWVLDRPAGGDLGRSEMGEQSARVWVVNPFAWATLLALSAYRRFVPAQWKPECRFTPSCSEYTSLAIRKYGLREGVNRGRQRVRRCVGFMPGGVDWP